MAPEKTPQLEFKKGELKYYEGEARDVTANIAAEFDGVRMVLGMYPQARDVATDFVTGLPYDERNAKLDAFVAWNVANILDACAKQLLLLGTRDPSDPHLRLADVDLRAAAETPDPIVDDHALRDSFHDGKDNVDSDVAKSAGPADDAAIRESAGVDDADKSLKDQNDEEDEGDGGEGIQLGMIDAEGTAADPVRCAQKYATMLFVGVLQGYKHKGEARPSVTERMKPLVQHGVLTRKQIRQIVRGIFDTLAKFKRQRFRL